MSQHVLAYVGICEQLSLTLPPLFLPHSLSLSIHPISPPSLPPWQGEQEEETVCQQ